MKTHEPVRSRKVTLLSICTLMVFVGTCVLSPAFPQLSAQGMTEPRRATTVSSYAASLPVDSIVSGLRLSKGKGAYSAQGLGNVLLASVVQPAGGEENGGGAAEEVSVVAGESNDSSRNVTPEETPANEPATWAHTVTHTFIPKEDVSYIVTVQYNDDAAIPDGTELRVELPNVSGDTAKQRTRDLNKHLGLEEDDRVMQNTFLSVELVNNGDVILPQAPVKLSIQTNAINPAASDAVEIVPISSDKAKASNLQNLTGKQEDGEELSDPEMTHVSATVNELGNFGLATVTQVKHTWNTDDTKVKLWGPRNSKVEVEGDSGDGQAIDDVELIDSFAMQTKPTHAWAQRLWLSVETEASEEQDEFCGVLCRKVIDGELGDMVFEKTTNAKPVAISSDGDYALLWDSGYRNTVIDDGALHLEGMLPDQASADVQDVTDAYANTTDVVGADEGDKYDYQTIAAYDVSFSVDGEEWTPGDDHAVSSVVSSDAITQGQDVQVWRVSGDGEKAQVGETQVQDGDVTFPVQDAGTYVVVDRISLEREFVASDNNTYRVSVSYDGSAGLPRNAELVVNEVEQGSAEYDDYVAQSAEQLGTTTEDVKYAKALDISLVDPQTGERYQPTGDVSVRIELLDADFGDNTQVDIVHFGDEVDTIDAEIDGSEVSFQTDGFSVFVVVQTHKEQILTASDGKRYKVTVAYDNTSGIPADAELEVAEMSENDPYYNEYVKEAAKTLGKEIEYLAFAHAFDIKLVDKESGEQYQPTKDVKVGVELLTEELTENDDVSVVHFKGDTNRGPAREGAHSKGLSAEEKKAIENTETEILNAAVNEAGVVEFTSGSFSVYVITEAVPRRTYQFYIWKDDAWSPYMFTTDSGEVISSQTVRDGQKPTVPQPEMDATGKAFSGWYEFKEDSATEFKDEPYDFDSPVTQDEVVSLHAVFSDYLNVIFHDQYDAQIQGFPIACTRRGKVESGKTTVTIGDVKTTYSGGSDMAFYGWSRTPISVPGAAKDDNGETVTKVDSESIEITADTHLYPIYKSVKWLSFWSGPTGSGATYYPAESYFDGVGPTTLADHVPTRPGYTFLGWYAGTIDPVTNEVTYGNNPITNADGTLINNASDAGMTVYGGALQLTTDSALYAKWSGEDSANYKIIIWKQKTTASADTPDAYKYDFYSSIEKSAPIGGTATIDNEYKSYADTNSEYRKPEFGGYTCRSDADVTVNENGNTVLNVYYDRNGAYEGSGSPHKLTFKNSSDDSVINEYASVAYKAILLTGNNGGSFVPANQTRPNYTFTGWFADKICSTQVFFSKADLDAYKGNNKTVLYDEMPNEDLTIYAGWEAEWYLVQIDPNYGSFNGTGATWTWKTIESDLIQEYTQVTRDYVESSSGQYYYYKHDRAYYGYNDNEYHNNEPSNRDAGYTNTPGEATEYKRFEEAPGIYSYAGWYEVLADGTEIPYDFSKHVDHHTVIKLHWKKAGDFYLNYSDGRGTNSVADDVLTPDANCYADNAQVLITKSATAPEGYTFVGWRVQGNTDGPIYGVGATFTLHSDDAVSISGKSTVTLEAVYTKLGTAKIVYDFNGGTVDNDHFDFGHPKDSNDPVPLPGIAINGKTATVSNIVNNSEFYLSNGTGVTMPGATLKGWSNKPVYDPENAELYTLGGKYGVDTEEPITLYAVWESKVTWHLNVPAGMGASDFDWGGSWDGYSTETVNSEEVKTKTVYRGNAVAEPSDVLRYGGAENQIFISWADAADSTTAYDYSRPVMGALNLYAHWGEAKVVTAHAVDASAQDLAEKTNGVDGWTVNNVTVGPDEIALNGSSHVTAPEGYTFAFAAVSQDLESVSPANEITHIRYSSSNQKIEVQYKGESTYRVLGDDRDIYFVYYQNKSLNIGYKEMKPSGVLESVSSVSASAHSSSGPVTGIYSMASDVSTPLAWGNNNGNNAYTNYAFAIGRVDLNDQNTQMNASDLSLITAVSNSDDSRPVLRVRNTWRGFEYTTESGEDAEWISCGYDPQLYVVYYVQTPTVVMFSEKTLGLSTGPNAVVDTAFTFNLKVMETTTAAQKQQKTGDVWENVGSPEDYTTDVFDTTVSPNTPYVLKNGEANSAILFYGRPGADAIVKDAFTEGAGTFRYVATADSVTSQTAVITQTANPAFTTYINDSVQDSEPYQYEYTSEGTGGTRNAIFTNKHKEAAVEVHVARIENGSINLRDTLRSTSDETTYKFSLPINESKDILTEIPADTVYKDDAGVYAFGSVVLGTDNGTVVNVDEMNVANISYDKTEESLYALLLKNSSGASLGGLGYKRIYYLYYPMPKIQYIKKEGTTLSRIMGSTDGINPSTSITYGGTELQMNGVTVVQDQRVALPLSGLRISQASGAANFNMPPILDDGIYQQYLTYTSIGVGSGIGSGQAQDISELGDNVSDQREMLLQIKDNALQWSFDGKTWYPMNESQTIYSIYTESGYDFQISKVVDTSASGSNPIFTDRQFTVTIEPASGNTFNKEQYDIEGYSSRKINVEDGKITLTVGDGTQVKILGLRRGGYVVTESNNANYDLLAKSGPIVGSATTAETVSDSSVNFTLDNEKQLVLTNRPKALCEVVRGSETDGVLFYTLTDAINYIMDHYADGTATIAMLTDYLMPEADALTIPSSAHIKLITATEGNQKYSGTGKAIISRSSSLSSAPMIANHGELTLINITLDGKSVASTAPMLQSNGTLTVDRGTTLQNAVNSGNGGAISATGNVSVVNGYEVQLKNNLAANGGLIYYAGTGAIEVAGGSISGNTATQNGGAIYAVGGTVTLSGGSVGGSDGANRATNGGAVYVENAVIQLSGTTVSGNNASASGGAVYSAAGAVTLSGGSVAGNTATENGGAICVGSGTVTASGGSIRGNIATSGNGGAIYTNNGAVEIFGNDTSTSISGNTATNGNGGAVYSNTGNVTIVGGNVGGSTGANRAKNGGAIYANNGTVSITGGNVIENIATENGGAVYVGSGAASVSGGSIAGNSATGTDETTGFGGAVFVETGSAQISGGTIGVSGTTGTANTAKNGSAVYIKAGTGAFSGGTISGNTSTSGGAVGVGSETVRLDFSGTTQITGNTMSGAACNVYLDQDTDGVINTGGFGSGAYVGIYVPGEKNADLFKNRGDVGAEFGLCSGSATTLPAFHNDRETNLKAAVDSVTKKIYWSSPIQVRVQYLEKYESELPNGTNGTSKYNNPSYYPATGNTAISVLAEELRTLCVDKKGNSTLTSTAVYATALANGNTDYSDYRTKLLWENGKWRIEKRDGTKDDLDTTKELVVYFSEPAYVSIENNTEFDFNITSLTVNLAGQDRSLLNNSGTTGFGLVFAKNGAIQEQLLPVQADESGTYTLSKNGGSVTILIPGGRNRNFSLSGSFVNGTGMVPVRQTGQTASDIAAAEPVNRTGKTLTDSSIYEIIFGTDKAICKIWCAEPTGINEDDFVARSEQAVDGKYEYTFSKVRNAVSFAQKYKLIRVDIQMLVDYLMPSTDTAVISDPSGHHFESIELSTASTGEFRYSGTSSDGRATISRGIGNEQPLVDVTGNVGTSGNDTETHVNVHDINFDGKNLVGKCEGGALATKDCCVSITNAKLVNCVSYNGGAVFISYGTPRAGSNKTNVYIFASGYHDENATLTVSNATFDNCKAQYQYARSGGGAIWTNAKSFTVSNTHYSSCKSTGEANMQGGAVFHRIEATTKLGADTQTPYFAESQSEFNDCTFTACVAQGSGGAMESDACNIKLNNCTFTSCSTTGKDGAALNVYIYETSLTQNSVPSELHLDHCHFVSCTSGRNGGAVRSLAVDTEIKNCEFTNCTAKGEDSNGGGAVYVNNTLASTTNITDCTFTSTRVTSKGSGGAIYSAAKQLSVKGTSVDNCQAIKNGGAIYHSNATKDSYTSLSDCTITSCSANLSGGAVYSNALNGAESNKLLVGCTIRNCVSKGTNQKIEQETVTSTDGGGGVYLANYNIKYAIIENSTIENCAAALSGGGLYSQANTLIVSSSTRVSGCESGLKGGGIYHRYSASTANLSSVIIENCTAKEDGGGFYTDYRKGTNVGKVKVSFADSVVRNCAATNGNGGGICQDSPETVSLKDTTIVGNKAGGMGGGVYTNKYLTLIQSIIEGNKLTTNTVDNAAGVYMTDDGVLVVGETGSEVDNSAVMNNTTANGADSNLRMPVKSDGSNENKSCVTVNCPLGSIDGKGGYIGVTNAWKVGTQFGVYKPNQGNNDPSLPDGLKDPDGVTVLNAVFNADTSTLYGIISRTDAERTQIVWAGPPICKITDSEGNLLYFKSNGSDPAIFDILENGAANGRTSAFSLLRGAPTLYYKPETEGGAGTKYTGSVFVIKMLVEEYELTHQITTVDNKGKTIVLTTADKGDKDGYPFDRDASGTRSEITRGSNVTGSMAIARTNMQFRNILLDGDSSHTTSTDDGAIVSVGGTQDIKVELLANAVFQNGKAANGGAVSVTNGTFQINGGLIRFCEATTNGGAVYASNSNAAKGFVFAAGNIQQCSATDGAGVYVNDGVFTMSGGSISGCAASGSGGGVYVASEKTMNMSGGRIGTDGANTAVASGGGIAAGDNAQLNFSKQVNISKNTCEASEAIGKICNLQLDQDSNGVIRTEGLYARSYIGVYVPGHRDDENPEYDSGNYRYHGREGDPFGYYEGSTANLHCFVNDRNGLKGGRTNPFAEHTIYWIKIFSIEISKGVTVSDNVPDSVKEAAEDQEFTFIVRLWDTNNNVSSVKVKDIADEIAAAAAAGEDSKYGNIPFAVAPNSDNSLITAQITMKSGEYFTAENLPDGLGYDVTEEQVTGYANIPHSLREPVYFRAGRTGENKNRTDVNPYVSTVTFNNILPACKITDESGTLLYRNACVKDEVEKGEQTPAVYKDLSEAFAVINGGGNLYMSGSNLSFSGNVRIEMLLPDYTLTTGQTLPTSHAVTLTTADDDAIDNFPFNPTVENLSGRVDVAIIKRGGTFTNAPMLTLDQGSDLTITNVKLDGNLVPTTAMGGLVYVPTRGKLTVTNGAILQNSRTTGAGAGVYVARGGNLYLSGNPIFGTTDTDSYGYLHNNIGNFRIGDLKDAENQWLQNGGKDYKVAHQDIYLAESQENAPSSMVITGDLTGDAGSIWVWAESEYHSKQLMPFARVAEGITFAESNDVDNDNKIYDKEHLKIFRNARDDESADNTTGDYLYGTIDEAQAGSGSTPVYVCWNGIKGSRRVILRKVSSTYTSVPDALFTIYRKGSSSPVVIRHVDKPDETLENLKSQSSGVIWIGDMPYGTYYVREAVPAGYQKTTNGDTYNWFILTVNENGVGYLENDGSLDMSIDAEVDKP